MRKNRLMNSGVCILMVLVISMPVMDIIYAETDEKNDFQSEKRVETNEQIDTNIKPKSRETVTVSTTSSVQVINGIPTIYLNDKPFNVSGWIVGFDPETETVVDKKAVMDLCVSQGFTTIQLPFCWYKHEWTADNVYDWSDIDTLMDYAKTKGLMVILQAHVNSFAYPWWYYDIAINDDGFVKNQYGNYPVVEGDTVYLANFYHDDWYTYAGDFVTEFVNRYKNDDNLLGWVICPTYTGENNYQVLEMPGYENEMFDYSDYSRSLFGAEPPVPIEPHFAGDSPDDRALWREWIKFRNIKKRECYSYFGELINSLDPNHIMGVYPNPPLGGGGFPDLWAMTKCGYDIEWLIRQPWCDFVRSGGIHLNPCALEYFYQYSYYTEYGLIRYAHRYGKAVINEPTRTGGGPNHIDDILALAAFQKSLGAYHTWVYALAPGCGYEPWTPTEKNRIGDTQPIASLAQPGKLTTPKLAIVDFPYEHTFYYTEKYFNEDDAFIYDTYTVYSNMDMINAFADAGVPFDVVDNSAIINNQTILTNYDMVVLTLPRNRIATYIPVLDTILSNYEIDGRIVREMDKLFTPTMKNYYMHRHPAYSLYNRTQIKENVIDPLRATIDSFGIPRHCYPDYGIIIYGLKPYLFVYPTWASGGFSGEIQFDISGWDLVDGKYVIKEVIGGDILYGWVEGNKLILNEDIEQNKAYLFEVTHTGLLVDIVKPKENHLYVFDKEIMPSIFGNTFIIGKITIKANACGKNGIEKVEFYIDDELKFTDYDMPYDWPWNEKAFGNRELKVIAYDIKENKAAEKIEVKIFNIWR